MITILAPTTIPYRSGAGLNAFNLAKELRKQGYSVRIVCFSQGKDSFYECIESIDIWRMPYSQNRLARVLAYSWITFFMFYIVRKSRLTIIFGPMQGYLLAIFFGWIIKKIVVFRSTMLGVDDLSSLNRKYGSLVYATRKKLHSLMYGYLSQSPSMTHCFMDEYADRKIILESPQGVDTSRFKPNSLLSNARRNRLLKNNLSHDTKIILSIGYLIERKGYREVFEVLSKIDEMDFLYVIIGKYDAAGVDYMGEEDLEMKALRRYGTELLNAKVLFLGEVENVQDYYQIADVFLLNSNQEGLPNVLLEAMSTGVPVICRELEGVNNYITFNGCNSLVINSSDQLENALKRIILDEDLAQSLSNESRKFIEDNCSFENYAVRLIDQFYNGYID